MREGSCGTRTVRPNSSTTSCIAGGAGDGGAGMEDWARRGKPVSKNAATAKTRARCITWAKRWCTNLLLRESRENFENKKPGEKPGSYWGRTLSRSRPNHGGEGG